MQNSIDKNTEAGAAPNSFPARWFQHLLGSIGPWHYAFVVLLGLLAGVGSFTFGYGEGWSYLSNDPAACANCHIMQDQYNSWQNSSHKNVAACNDCHLSPHPIRKWVTKGDNGFFHSLAFTTGQFHEPIQIKGRNRQITQDACLHCHVDFVHNMLPTEPDGDMLLCIQCHTDVGHSQRP